MSETEAYENAPRESGFDAPVDDPSGDLLDMDQQARELAQFVEENIRERPFTLGIYGGWGEGKTTLVNLLAYHLQQRAGRDGITFIRFSAWPYTTTDKLWRALILKIARVIFKKEPADECAPPHAGGEPSAAVARAADGGMEARDGGRAGRGAAAEAKREPDGAGEQSGWLPAVRRFLEGDALILSEPPPARDDYAKVMRGLEESDYGEVSRRGAAAQLNEGATMSAVFGGALTLLGNVSPVFAGLRGFLGLGPKVDVAELIQREKEEARGKVQALPDFRRIFREIISRRENSAPVYIFIDDLDRVQPDVAFDIVDSIRIALWEPDCIFILAIDEAVIADGWLMRLKARYSAVDDLVAAQKGRDYLEKIIQLRVQLPTRTPEQLQRFLAALYPEWQAAGDFIQMIVGTNPRRLKQYCLRLNLQATVGVRTLGPGRYRRRADAVQAGGAQDGAPRDNDSPLADAAGVAPAAEVTPHEREDKAL